MPLELRESLGLAHDRPIGDRKPRNKAILDYSRGLRNIAVPPALSTDEAAALFELWMKDRALYGGKTGFTWYR
jgi:small subunit ribosomal protein S29